MNTKQTFGYDMDENGQRIVLGSGMAGNTYRGWVLVSYSAGGGTTPTERLKEAAALKHYTAGVADTQQEGGADFQREKMLLAPLDHPNIVKFLGFFYDHRVPVLATRLVEGHTLHDLALDQSDAGTLRDPAWAYRVLSWGYKLAGVLEYLQQAEIIHRDIKPSNIMIQEADEEPVLLDFGIGKSNQPHRFEGYKDSRRPAARTPHFASPEQFPEEYTQMDAPAVSERSDIYSLGTTLAWTLEPSSVRTSEAARSTALERRPLTGALPGFGGLRRLIEKMTAPVPQERPSAQEVSEALLDIITEAFPEEGLPARADIGVIPPPPQKDMLPPFRFLKDGVEIAELLLSQHAANFYLFRDSTSIDFAGANQPTRLDFEMAMRLINKINGELQMDAWIYSLPTRDDWYAGAGSPPNNSYNPHARLLFRDTGHELEWLQDVPTAGLPECHSLALLTSEGQPEHYQRHRRWPKGAVRLLRKNRGSASGN